VVGRRGAARLEGRPGLGDAARAREAARPETLGRRGGVPGVDQELVGGGPAADRVEAGGEQRVRAGGGPGHGTEKAIERAGHWAGLVRPVACVHDLLEPV
jgi:hypothetical protein